MQKRWHILQPDPDTVQVLQNALGCHIIIARLLANRNLASPEAATRFLRPGLSQIRRPNLITDIERAAERLTEAVEKRERILLFGDYDVDGVTAVVLLYEFLKYAGAFPEIYIPHRTQEGYGLRKRHIQRLAVKKGFRLIVTADCGSGSIDAIRTARDYGIDVVVTDHHRVTGDIPDARAFVNPVHSSSGMGHLSGVGVAFYLLIALRMQLRERGAWDRIAEPNLKDACDLVALGTIADMVPLVGENRVLSRTGIEIIQSGKRRGLSALVNEIGLDAGRVDAEEIAFRLAPRLNAAGRLAHAIAGARLLLTSDPITAARIARMLNRINQRRQMIEKQTVEDALAQIDDSPSMLNRRSLVVSGPFWNEGVLGIVASRLARSLVRPVVVLSTRNGLGKGSARSIPGIDLHACLGDCNHLLDRFGGHSQAAGLQIKECHIEQLREEFEASVAARSNSDSFVETLRLDCEIEFKDISGPLIDELDALRPFGVGNPEPLFLARDVRVVSSRIVGDRHRKLRLAQMDPSFPHVEAIHFNVDSPTTEPVGFAQVAFRLRWNLWNGRRSLQAVIEAADPAPS